MKEHLIDKEKTDVIKGIAILIVVLGHYARFMSSPIPIASHVPYFGAALFAFMSGYGTMLSYLDNKPKNWVKWSVGKLERVLFPFIFTNVISLPLYEKGNLIKQIFLGINDDVMWYPIFILGFYAAFEFSYGLLEKKGIIVLWGIVFFLYAIMVFEEISSTYYTSILPLIVGVIIAKYEDMLRGSKRWLILAASIVLIISILISVKGVDIVKYAFTGLAGAMLSIIVFLMVQMTNSRLLLHELLHAIGCYSYFAYLVHMKVFFVVDKRIGTASIRSFILFIMCTLIITIILQKMWEMMVKYFQKWIKG